jgi:hypothetical protein
MRKILIALAATAALASPSAFAQEGTAAGVAGGAATGAVIGGPVGAVVGGIAGGVLGTAIDPPPAQVQTYVVEQRVQPATVEGEIVVGAPLPDVVELHTVPDYEYRYAFVNGKRVLVDPGSRKVVYVVQ